MLTYVPDTNRELKFVDYSPTTREQYVGKQSLSRLPSLLRSKMVAEGTTPAACILSMFHRACGYINVP